MDIDPCLSQLKTKMLILKNEIKNAVCDFFQSQSATQPAGQYGGQYYNMGYGYPAAYPSYMPQQQYMPQGYGYPNGGYQMQGLVFF